MVIKIEECIQYPTKADTVNSKTPTVLINNICKIIQGKVIANHTSEAIAQITTSIEVTQADATVKITQGRSPRTVSTITTEYRTVPTATFTALLHSFQYHLSSGNKARFSIPYLWKVCSCKHQEHRICIHPPSCSIRAPQFVHCPVFCSMDKEEMRFLILEKSSWKALFSGVDVYERIPSKGSSCTRLLQIMHFL
jgi:hypothetical protein